jgi:hypothetical protein
MYAWISTLRHRRWVNRVEFQPWWLVKALKPELYTPGYGNATEKDLKKACTAYRVSYRDVRPELSDLGYLRLCPASRSENELIGTESIESFTQRPFA